MGDFISKTDVLFFELEKKDQNGIGDIVSEIE